VAIAMALMSSVAATSAFALEREENVYAEAQPAKQPHAPLPSAASASETRRDEARSSAGFQILPDGSNGASAPAKLDRNMYDYMRGPAIPAGG
jgi:hypothetical protein